MCDVEPAGIRLLLFAVVDDPVGGVIHDLRLIARHLVVICEVISLLNTVGRLRSLR
jgi:hypothetical protein